MSAVPVGKTWATSSGKRYNLGFTQGKHTFSTTGRSFIIDRDNRIRRIDSKKR